MHNVRSILLRLTAATAVFGAVFAMAATLGVTGDSLGAGNQTVASCDADGVTTTYATTYDATDRRYEVPTVTVKAIAAACNGETMKVTLVDSSGAALSSGTKTVAVDALTPDTEDDVSLTSAVSAAAVTGVHVVIAG